MTLRRPSRRRLVAALAVLALASVIASLTIASAAQLNLGAVARQHMEARERCDLDGVATTTPGVTGTTTRVDVSGIHASCAGLPIVVRVYTTAGATSTTTSANVPSGGGSMTINTASPAYTPTTTHQTYVTIGGWPIPSTWSYTPPVATTWCRVEVNSGSGWTTHPTAGCSFTHVTLGSSWPTPITHRQVTLHFSYTGVPTGSSHRIASNVDLSPHVTLGSGQSWATSTIEGWGVTGSALPTVYLNFGNSHSGSGSFSTQLTVIS